MATPAATRGAPTALDNALAYALKAGQQGWLFFRVAIADVTRHVKDYEAVDATLRGIEDAVALRNILRKTQNVASPLIDKIGSVRNIFRLCRLANSFNYIVSGELYRDVVNKRALPIITQGAFLLGRSIGAVNVFVHMKVLTWESLAIKAAKIGGVRAFNLVNFVQKPQVFLLSYLVALSALMVPEAMSLYRGEEKRDVHALNLTSLALDVGIIALELLNFQNKALLFGMGIVAAGTAVWGSFADPSNYVAS